MDISGAGRARKARRRALLSASVVAAILAATGCAATAAPGHARVATGHVRAATDHVRAAADSARTAAARLRTRSAVSWMAVPAHAAIPWGQVGPGWALAQYSDTPRVIGHQPKPGPTTLYLVDPGARTYRLFTWPGKSVVSDWTLEAWSGDTKRALFVSDTNPGPQKVYQLQLRTGQITGFTMPANVSVIGYTRPAGLGIVAELTPGNTNTNTILRYDLQGQLQNILATGPDPGSLAYSASGTMAAAGTQQGLELVSNAGKVIRQLPVPESSGCDALRWWAATVVLAACPAGLTLVPVNSAPPRLLTAQSAFNAWQLSSGLYLDADGACGTVDITKRQRHGPAKIVNVPDSQSSLIVAATRTQLLVQRLNPCAGGSDLVWFNPATASVTVALPVHDVYGVIGVVPYFVQGKF
jgi:hypothetical protein